MIKIAKVRKVIRSYKAANHHVVKIIKTIMFKQKLKKNIKVS